MPPRAYLIDSNIYIYRAWHGSTVGLRDAEGRALNAVHGFAEFLLRVLEDIQTDRVMLAFDIPQENPYRREIYPAYKGQRSPPPADLIPQFALCRALAAGLNLPIHTSDRYEADDVIGTLAACLRAEGHALTLLTADKDLAQLLQGTTAGGIMVAARYWTHAAWSASGACRRTLSPTFWPSPATTATTSPAYPASAAPPPHACCANGVAWMVYWRICTPSAHRNSVARPVHKNSCSNMKPPCVLRANSPALSATFPWPMRTTPAGSALSHSR